MIQLVPDLLGKGIRLFDGLNIEPIILKRTEIQATSGIMSMRFCILE